jgi:hypothetical protein
MSRKKISTTIYVTPEQNEQLRLLHARTKVPVAVFIREGIDLVLARHAHLLPGQLQLTSAPVRTPSVGPDPLTAEADGRAVLSIAPSANQETPAAAGDRRT